MAIRWGLSVLDWHSHAIDEWGDHPIGVFKAECGHLLMVVTTLHDRPTGSRARRAPRNSSSAR